MPLLKSPVAWDPAAGPPNVSITFVLLFSLSPGPAADGQKRGQRGGPQQYLSNPRHIDDPQTLDAPIALDHNATRAVPDEYAKWHPHGYRARLGRCPHVAHHDGRPRVRSALDQCAHSFDLDCHPEVAKDPHSARRDYRSFVVPPQDDINSYSSPWGAVSSFDIFDWP